MDRAAGMYRRVQKEPNWVTKAAAMAGFLVLVVPIVVLGFAALLTGVVVFTVLAFVNRAWRAVTGRSLFFGSAGGGSGGMQRRSEPGDDLRENVRVIGRD